MKHRPIIMSAESVRAILDDRKTQTRRVVKPQPGIFMSVNDPVVNKDGFVEWKDAQGVLRKGGKRCPYGAVGDRLWCKEVWALCYGRTSERGVECSVEYAAGGPAKDIWFDWRPSDRHGSAPPKPIRYIDKGKRSPLFMPRWASRLTLEITDVRVERVQEISEDDARAEGLYFDVLGWYVPGVPATGARTAGEAFAQLWNRINAKRGYPWESNLWVWAITFKRATP